MEKPLTTDVAEGERMVAAARERDVKLMVNFSNPAGNPKFLAAWDAVRSGRMGDFVMGYSRLSNTVSVPTSMLAWASKSGPEWFLFPHTVDIVRWIVGREATRVYAAGRKGVLAARGIDAYDAIQAVVHFDDAFVTFETCWVIPNSWPSVVDSTMTLYGSGGRLEVDQNDQGITLAGERFETSAPYGRYDSHGRTEGFYLEGIRHFVDCLVDDREPVVTGEDGLAVTRVITAIRDSIASGGTVAVAPLP